ncbi:hypothetical protein FB45DRAFT_892012 [Roridomyces roridus]|uniref:DUF6699 domain-containing protein n=1 Tax=Roridomyces roridus TaxID=1738132 RepID=A0AAD7CEI2_9AGAR|nr:hypothetical protein FB45DRAFT_892012 [Roridomyces roridus]
MWGNPWQPPAYYQQPHPANAFAQPGPPGGFPGFWGQAGWVPPPNAGYLSNKYPGLNPILAADANPMKYDVRKKARNEIAPATYMPIRNLYATSSSAVHIRLISKSFPWSIDVMSNTPVTVEAIWDALYAALQQHIADSEWGILVNDKDRKYREAIEKATKRRVDAGDADSRLKRIDWLGAQTLFKGLEKVDGFQELRLLPGAEDCPETWVVKLGSL